MKPFLTTLLISISFICCCGQNAIDAETKEILMSTNIVGEYIQKLIITKVDSSLYLYANIRKDYRTFGYEKADTNSKKIILFSIFTNYIKDNPFNCTLGSYYQTQEMNMKLKFISKKGAFVKTIAIKEGAQIATIYFLKKCVEFEK